MLGISQQATVDDAKQAFRKLALRFHPDVNQNDAEAESKFIELHEAYAVLSDEQKRKSFDKYGIIDSEIKTEETLNHYFKMHCNVYEIKSNEEFEVALSYTGEGRYYTKPDLSAFLICCKPYVTFRDVMVDGFAVKETNLTYVLAARYNGVHTIGSASIRIFNKPCSTNPVTVYVKPNACYFLKSKTDDGPPYIFRLYVEDIITGKYMRTLTQQEHRVPVPRSRAAWRLHNTGLLIKYVFAIYCFVFLLPPSPFFIKAISSICFGGVNCHLFYKLVGVKSKFYYVLKYPRIKNYLDNGYFTRVTMFDDNKKIFSRIVFFIESLLK